MPLDGSPSGKVLRHGASINSVRLIKNDTMILTASKDGTVKIFDLRYASDFPVEYLPLLVETETGTVMDAYGSITFLGYDQWQVKKQKTRLILKKHLAETKYPDAPYLRDRAKAWSLKLPDRP